MSRLNNIVRLAVFTLVTLIGACSLGPKENIPLRTYLLNPEISWKNPHAFGAPLGHSILVITQPKAQAGFDTARMAYLLRPYEVNYFAFNQWADTPARMLQRIMVENLDKAGMWSAVVQTPGAVPAQYRLDCDSLVFEQQFLLTPAASAWRCAFKSSKRKNSRFLAADISNFSKQPRATIPTAAS